VLRIIRLVLNCGSQHSMTAGSGFINDFDSTGPILASTMYITGVRPDRVDIWNYETKQHLAALINPRDQAHWYTRTACGSSDGRMLAVLTQDFRTVVVWDISDIEKSTVKYEILHPGAATFVQSMCFTKNCEQLVVVVGIDVKVYDAFDGRLLHITDPFIAKPILVHPVGEEILTITEDGTMRFWYPSLEGGRQQCLDRKIHSACVSPSGNLVAVAELNGTLLIIDLITFETMVTMEHFLIRGRMRLQFNATGTRLLVKSHETSSHTHIYDLETATLFLQLNSVGDVCYSFDGTCIYGGTSDHTLGCRDAESGTLLSCPFAAESSSCFLGYCKVFVFATPDH
jgi:WD40 repeat protein